MLRMMRGVLPIFGLIASLCSGRADPLDLDALAQASKQAETLVRVEFKSPLSASDLDGFRAYRMRPAEASRFALVGSKSAQFFLPAGAVRRLRNAPAVADVRWVPRYPVATHYRVYFQLAEDKPVENLRIAIAAPRSAQGRERRSLHYLVDPATKLSSEVDAAGNEWVSGTFASVKPGDYLRFDFFADYTYDTAKMCASSFAFIPNVPVPKRFPSEVEEYLQPGFHIESDAPEIKSAAAEIAGSGAASYPELAAAVVGYVRRHVKYDNPKRDEYFGGKLVTSSLWTTYQGAVSTLQRGVGCCPDTAELKTAIFRALGIPARNCVQAGHLYSEVFVPGHGWYMDAPQKGIPLLIAPGKDSALYYTWTPEVKLRQVTWHADKMPLATVREGYFIDAWR